MPLTDLILYYLADFVFAAFDSSSHRLCRRDGAIGIYLGGADPVNYYDNGAHFFRSRSGTNLLTLDGSNANFSANVRTGAFFLMDQMYGATLVGLYDPARFRGIYAMGTAYQMSADGSSLGSLYGLFFAYDAPGYQVVSGHTLSHGFGLAEAGVAKFFCGSVGMWHAGPAWFDGSVTAPLFKDTTTGKPIAPVIVSTSAPSTSAPEGTLWIQVT